MIAHQAVQPAESSHRIFHQFPAVCRVCQLTMHRHTVFRTAAFGRQIFCFLLRALIVEDYFCARLDKKTHGCRANATRTTRDKRNFSGEREHHSLMSFLICHSLDAKRRQAIMQPLKFSCPPESFPASHSPRLDQRADRPIARAWRSNIVRVGRLLTLQRGIQRLQRRRILRVH